LLLAAVILPAAPATAMAQGAATVAYDPAAVVPDAELARMTGKFLLPNGAEIAMSIVSAAAVDGRSVLRTVLTVDNGVDLKIFARPVSATDDKAASTAGRVVLATGAATASVLAPSVTFDRQSGVRMESATTARTGPTISVAAGINGGDHAVEAAAHGLAAVTLVPGAPAIATADGTISLSQVANGTVVALNGDRFGFLQLLGRSIATAAINTADNRVVDTTTDVSIDLRNVTPYAMGGAMMRADALALDATTRMIR
jgi:hypothetical protein